MEGRDGRGDCRHGGICEVGYPIVAHAVDPATSSVKLSRMRFEDYSLLRVGDRPEVRRVRYSRHMHIHARLLHRLLQLGDEPERVRDIPAAVNEVNRALDFRQGLDRVRLPVDEEVD